MKLVSLEVVGLGPVGWSSGRLEFGRRSTQLFAENGSGKTPMVQAMIFALGYKVDFPNDIREHCDRVILEVAVDEKTYKIQRAVKGSFDVTVEALESSEQSSSVKVNLAGSYFRSGDWKIR